MKAAGVSFFLTAGHVCVAATVTLAWAGDLTPEQGYTFVSLWPGVVQTDMLTTMLK